MLKDGRPMWHHVASLVDEWGEEMTGDVGLSSVGAVVGATHPKAVAEARRLMPRTIFLLPGVGAQGGSVADLGACIPERPVERARLGFPLGHLCVRDAGTDFREAAGAEASRLKREVWAASGW